MNKERIYQVLLGPVISEKTSLCVEYHGQYGFKVIPSATKLEIKKAVEALFGVDVALVRTLVMKGKVKRTRHGDGQRSKWKKAYVSLAQGQEIDFENAE